MKLSLALFPQHSICTERSNAYRALRNSAPYRSAPVRLDVEELIAAGTKMAKGRYSPGGLISRQAVLQLDDSRLIVAIPSHGNGGVRIPDEGETRRRVAPRQRRSDTSQPGTLNRWYVGHMRAKFLRRLSRLSRTIVFFPRHPIWKPCAY